MFYRVGKVSCKEGKSDDVLNYFRSNDEFFGSIKGIHSLSYFKSGHDEVTGVAVWESKEILDSNAEKVQSIMAGLMEYVTGHQKFLRAHLNINSNKNNPLAIFESCLV